MIDVQAALDASESGARMLLQVHDELLLEVPDGELEKVQAMVVDRMEGAIRLDVPLAVDVGVGTDWYSCKG